MIAWFVALVVLIGIGYCVWLWFRKDRGPAASQRHDATVAAEKNANPIPSALSAGVLDDSSEHTWQHGHYLGQACDLAYQPESTAVPLFRTQLCLDAKLVQFDNTQAYVCENSDAIVIAFRGSEKPNSLDGFKDWLLTNARNFLVLPTGRIGTDFAAAGVGARFHRGFMEALAEIWTPLLTEVEAAIQRQERPVWVTGHSLGGAIALLAAWRLHQKFIAVHRIVTFGAPMIGNAAAAEAFHREFPDKIIRYVDYSDMVPKLPTMSLLTNEYGHVQREIIVGQETPSSAEQLIAKAIEHTADGHVNDAVAENLWGNLHAGISAHLMGNYISRLSERIG